MILLKIYNHTKFDFIDEFYEETVPLSNVLFSTCDFEFFKIIKGTATELTKKQIIELFKRGSCIGTFDFSLQNLLIQV